MKKGRPLYRLSPWIDPVSRFDPGDPP